MTRDIPSDSGAPTAVLAPEDQLRLLVDSVKDHAIFMLDSQGVIVSWNAGAARLKGYRPEEIIGEHFSRFYPEEDVLLGKPRNELEVAARDGRVEDEGWRIRKDGTRFWANVVITAVTDDEGALRGFAKVTRDMTERRNAELVEREYVAEKAHAEAQARFAKRTEEAVEALRDSEAQFRLLLDSTAEGIYGIGRDGMCTFCNPAAARLLGYSSPDELIGKRLHNLIHHTRSNGSPFPLAECRIHGSFLTGVGQHVVDEVFWRADGTCMPVDYFSYPIYKDGQVVGSVVTFLDITDRRRAEAALEEKEDRFRQLTEASFEGILVAEGGLIVEANRGLAEMFGYAPKEIIGMAAMDLVAEESTDAVRRRVTRHIEGRYEVVGRRKDGRRIFLEAASKTHIATDRVVRITALRDVTEKRALEDRFRQAQKMEAVGRLAGGVAHDFNNLLTVILSYTDMLMQEVPADDTRREDLGQIRNAAVGAASLTRQLLAFSRQQVIEPRLLDVNELVGNSTKMLRRLIGEDVELVVAASSQPLTVKVDPGQLDQVIMNLAVNARDAMPQGGVLAVETARVTLDAEYARDHWPATAGRFAMIAVSDNGVGMDEDTRTRIFEPFFTTKEAGKGTGLGLATVYGIIKQSNGFIWVYSEPGQGATFKIYLPLIDAAADPYQPKPQLVTVPSGDETVLLAEDAPEVRLAARQILERQGYTVLEAPTARTALDMAANMKSPIHLLLTDVVMPELGGRELAEEFAKLRPEAKVLYMSGYTDDAIVRYGVLNAGVAYLQKPFDGEALGRKVRQVLDDAR